MIHTHIIFSVGDRTVDERVAVQLGPILDNNTDLWFHTYPRSRPRCTIDAVVTEMRTSGSPRSPNYIRYHYITRRLYLVGLLHTHDHGQELEVHSTCSLVANVWLTAILQQMSGTLRLYETGPGNVN